MKVNSIIISGPQASGKTFLANAIAKSFPVEKVLQANSNVHTLTWFTNSIEESGPYLIILDECIDLERIIRLNKGLVEACWWHDEQIRTFLFLTQSEIENDVKEFTVIRLK